MTHNLSGAAWATWSLVLLAIVAGILAVGYLAYRTRRVREEVDLRSRDPGPDPVDQLADVNDSLEARLAEARSSLEATRDAVRDGVRW